jgi:hypothetical protein
MKNNIKILSLYLLFSNSNLFSKVEISKFEKEQMLRNETEFDYGKDQEIIRPEISGIGLANGELGKKNLSDVINIAPGYNPRTFLRHTGNEDLSIELDGKIRIDSLYGHNTRFLNSGNNPYDDYLVPGKSTLDLGLGIAYGMMTHGREVIDFGIDLRNRSTWGKPDEVATTTVTSLKDGAYSYGTHKHDIGVPVLYVRGFDLTIDINALSKKPIDDCPLNHFKLGFFPFEIGRGISLGAAYAVTPDLLTYEPGDVIQEFAPGIMFTGILDKNKKLKYRSYLGILKNESANSNDVNEQVRGMQYGHKYFPQRGFGVFNIVWGTQFDYKLLCEGKDNLILSPYIIYAHEGEEKALITSDSFSNLVTLGFDLNGKYKKMEFDIEFAQNIGKQNVLGIDTNNIISDIRVYTDENNASTVTNILVNDNITYIGETVTTDIKNKNAAFLGASDPRQIAINSVYPSAENNSQKIEFPAGSNIYSLQNSATRFRDPYQNYLKGFMIVGDYSYNLTCFEKDFKWNLAAGYASGDENPNSSLEKKGDYMKNSNYTGFISIQEIYSGKTVRSVFLLSGVGKIPRILSIPAIDSSSSDPIAFPTKIGRFNNITYFGTSINTNVESCNYNWKFNPNILIFYQPDAPIIYDINLKNKLGKESISPFLGTEINLFLESLPKAIDGLKFFAVATVFAPGSYYSDLKNVPLDKSQLAYIKAIESGKSAVFTNLIGNSLAFNLNLGLEYKF